MYCTGCGMEIPESARYCSQCGVPAGKYGSTSQAGKPAGVLRRSRDEKQIAGVCAGFARYLGVDVTLVRVATVILALWPPGIGLIGYLVCWIIIPKEPLLLAPPQKSQPQSAAIMSQ